MAAQASRMNLRPRLDRLAAGKSRGTSFHRMRIGLPTPRYSQFALAPGSCVARSGYTRLVLLIPETGNSERHNIAFIHTPKIGLPIFWWTLLGAQSPRSLRRSGEKSYQRASATVRHCEFSHGHRKKSRQRFQLPHGVQSSRTQALSTGNSKWLTSSREPVDHLPDGGSLRIDLVCYGRPFPVADSIASGNHCSSSPIQCAAPYCVKKVQERRAG